MTARLFLSAAHKSSGKTTVSIGLCAALSAQSMKVQAFKKGPDYIDPMWLSRASGRPCHNLDFHSASTDEIQGLFHRYAAAADISIIEGNKGLYDGLDLDGSNSNAALATLLKTPVLLVIDAQGMTRGIAPLILGYQAFDKNMHIAGVILNKLGGSRHESKLRAVIEHYTDVPVLGAVYRDPALQITERHLGLVPSNEDTRADARVAMLGERIGAQVDLSAIRKIACTAQRLQAPTPRIETPRARKAVRLGVIRDAAFGFYYPGDLEALALAGAELVFIDALHDMRLAPVDGLFIGGGFPEIHMQALEANSALRQDIRQAIEQGLPTYAECGGLMYLAKQLSWRGRQCEMVGVIRADAVMYDRPQGRGYVQLRETGHSPWAQTPRTQTQIAAHEFHYSRLERFEQPVQYAYEVLRGAGIDGRHDGLVYKNLLASYAHLRDSDQCPWTTRFIDCIYTHKNTARTAAKNADYRANTLNPLLGAL